MRSRYGRGKKARRKQPRPNYDKAARAKAKQAGQEERAAPPQAPERSNPDVVASPDPLAPPAQASGPSEPDTVASPALSAPPPRIPERRNPDTVSNPGPPAPPPRAPEPREPGPVVSLDPLAPVIVRSGRPFDDQSGPDPARFPPPSTVAGCLRTAWARATGRGFVPELAQMAVAGPLLLDRENRILVPKPADALYFGHGDEARCVRAEPRPFEPGCGADLPGALLPIQLAETVAGKPGSGPAWWSWGDLLAFRSTTDAGRSFYARLCGNGWSPPPRGDRRTHVAIDPKTGAADAGRLFQTEGLDLDAPDTAQDRGSLAGERHWPAARGGLRLLARCDEALGEGLAHLGGERRLAALQPEPEQTWPAPPPDWLDRIARAGGLSLTLLTPAIFSAGYRPGWLDDADLIGSPPAAPGLRLQLCAAAVERWQPHSGWDLARRQPRPSRKLAGAGATYWFRILGGIAPDALAALWLASVSDGEQDRRDGFGLALPSPWEPVETPADRAP